MTIQQIKTIGVVGAGTMGQGIAQVCASAGFQAILFDINGSLVENAVKSIEKNLQTLVEKGKLDADTKSGIIGRILTVESLNMVQADVIVEAVVEKLDVKQKLFVELEKNNSPEAILTSNTSSIPITQIAAGMKNPGRFAGLHFFNPAPLMKLVEVIRGVNTSPETAETLMQLVGRLSKHPVMAHDSPGFIVNRVARHFYVESLKLAEEKVADIETIDALMRSAGFKMGPFELMDLIGVDVNFAVTSSMYNSFHQDPKFRPSRIQQQKVDAGHHGRKTGRGFYDYPKTK